jgi:hypothetical protein
LSENIFSVERLVVTYGADVDAMGTAKVLMQLLGEEYSSRRDDGGG